MSRFNYVKYDADATMYQEDFKARFTELERQVETFLKPGRAKALVLTKLEEAYMWIGKQIRDDQIARGGDATHIAERTNE